MPSTFSIPVPPRFDLTRAVCSYGYFLLAPNRWDPKTRRLDRPLRGAKDRVIGTTISQPRRGGALRVACDKTPTKAERAMLNRQIARMLRLDEPAETFDKWHLVHPGAKRAGFARLFRSPTLFEDVVKTFTGCNVTWGNTMTMNRLMSEKIGPKDSDGNGAFPTPAELAACRPDWLKRNCKVGYRAERIIRLARDVVSGKLDLAALEKAEHTTEQVFDALTEIYGIGEYAAGNLCQLLGRYDRLAIDTETYRHFEEQYGVPRGKDPKKIHPRIEKHYAQYAPFQFLAYWFELWSAYQRRFNPAWQWDAERDGNQFTAAVLKKK